MREEAVTFGNVGNLVGILTNPDMALHTRNGPGVLLLNAGLLHRVGPYRLYVDLARKLGSMGFTVLRFDLSGKGDSLQGDDIRLYEERTVGDICEAMDFLSTKKGVDEFVLIGLCSGADNAHEAAVKDDRVTGAVFLDGYGYRTWGYYLHHYGPRLFRLQPWKNFLKRKCSNVIIGICGKGDKGGVKGEIFVREFPPKEKVEREIRGLVERGVNLLYIYSGGVAYHYYNYHGQFDDMFRSVDFRGRIRVEYFDKAQHTYPLLADRDKLMTCICDWMHGHYKGSQQLLSHSVNRKRDAMP